MNCPNCQSDHTVVKETRLHPDGGIARMRMCKTCTAHFTTLEVPTEVRITAECRAFRKKTPRGTPVVNLNTLWEIWKC